MKTPVDPHPAPCGKDSKPPTITVGQFFRDHAASLHLSLVGPERGFDRKILEPTINRPGLALSGFFQYFAAKRVQVIGSLIERGYSLVADDVTRFRAIEHRELMATAPSLTRYHMEVRGLGVINVAAIFGIGSIRTEKRLDFVVTLKDWQDMEEVDRVGLELETYRILNIEVPHVTIPVRPGRDSARLVEVAAFDQKLKSHGQHSSMEFNQRLVNLMHRKHAL